MSDKVPCPVCGKEYTVTGQGRLWKHGDCDGGGTVPPASRAPQKRFQQPGSPKGAGQAQPMSANGQEIAGRLREIFYSYNNRRSHDNRAAQETLGPSEVGTPCDRRLAMTLTGKPAVNPGGDGWAAFIGTAVHDALATMFEWANAGTGRYAVELPLRYDNPLMPRGTGDLLDRTLLMFLDHKVMGRWSLDKLRTNGPPDLYYTQVNIYAYGARQAGESVDRVAIAGWPREGSSLDDLYVWEGPYDPAVYPQAMERLSRIRQATEAGTPMRDFAVAADCKFCPFHAPGDDGMTRGCPGR